MDQDGLLGRQERGGREAGAGVGARVNVKLRLGAGLELGFGTEGSGLEGFGLGLDTKGVKVLHVAHSDAVVELVADHLVLHFLPITIPVR